MPYIQGGGPQGTSGLPSVSDVYHSGNVYANNVPIALWKSPGASGTFGGISVSVSVVDFDNDPIVSSAISTATSQVNAYIANPSQYYNAAASADGVKGNYAGTIDDGMVNSTATSMISTDTTFSSIVPFLDKCLDEAAQGKWRETGQGGKPSNPTITGIWQNIGYPNSGIWTTDQTAWCMGFINFGLKSSGYRYFQTASAAAITTNPEKWGILAPVPKDQAQPGDIAFWSYRHVNFVYTAQNGKYTFVGGNQSPKASNNPSDGDVTKSYPGGTGANNANWVSCWRPVKT